MPINRYNYVKMLEPRNYRTSHTLRRKMEGVFVVSLFLFFIHIGSEYKTIEPKIKV